MTFLRIKSQLCVLYTVTIIGKYEKKQSQQVDPWLPVRPMSSNTKDQ